ncbi:MAG: PPC domain-containing DNA-binding protein [Candidatus Eremiobacterota bacterium]
MKYTGTEDNIYVVKLENGDKLISCLTSLAEELNINFATITGIGAVKDPHVGYFVVNQKRYIEKRYEGNFELLSLKGNISIKEGKPFCHIHVILGDAEFKTFGGHLLDADVTVTMEIIIKPLKVDVERTIDGESSLYLWKI